MFFFNFETLFFCGRSISECHQIGTSQGHWISTILEIEANVQELPRDKLFL